MIDKEKKAVISELKEDLEYIELGLPSEVILMLWGKFDLIGILMTLMYLSRGRHATFITQPKLAKLVGLSYPTYLSKRKQLEELGLIEVKMENNNSVFIMLKVHGKGGLKETLRGSIKNLKTPPLPGNPIKLKEYIDITSKTLIAVVKKLKKNDSSRSIYNILYSLNTNNTNNIYSNNTNTKKKKKVITFPRENYDKVLEGYQKYKGVKLYGPEIPQHLRAIKTMFKSERKPDDILAFMKWLSDHENDEETKWVKTWTIWTVQKKINEFLAGKLSISSQEEITPL